MFGLPVVVFVKKSLCVCGVHVGVLTFARFCRNFARRHYRDSLVAFFCLFLFVLRFFAALFFCRFYDGAAVFVGSTSFGKARRVVTFLCFDAAKMPV